MDDEDNISIRSVSVDDFKTLYAPRFREARQPVLWLTDSLWREKGTESIREIGIPFVASRRGSAKGFSVAEVDADHIVESFEKNPEKATVVKMGLVFIMKDSRGTDLFQKLLKRAEDLAVTTAEERGHREAYVRTFAFKPELVSVYEKEGYTERILEGVRSIWSQNLVEHTPHAIETKHALLYASHVSRMIGGGLSAPSLASTPSTGPLIQKKSDARKSTYGRIEKIREHEKKSLDEFMKGVERKDVRLNIRPAPKEVRIY